MGESLFFSVAHGVFHLPMCFYDLTAVPAHLRKSLQFQASQALGFFFKWLFAFLFSFPL